MAEYVTQAEADAIKQRIYLMEGQISAVELLVSMIRPTIVSDGEDLSNQLDDLFGRVEDNLDVDDDRQEQFMEGFKEALERMLLSEPPRRARFTLTISESD